MPKSLTILVSIAPVHLICGESGLVATNPPYVWQLEYPANITAQVGLQANPEGSLTKLDLEMAGVLLQFLALEQIVLDLYHVKVAIG